MMINQSSKPFTIILLSVATLIGCDCGNKVYKGNPPKKQAPQADKNNLKQREVDYQPPRYTSKASDTPDTTPSKEAGTQFNNLDEVKRELGEIEKEVKINLELDELPHAAKLEVRLFNLVSTDVKNIKECQAKIQKYRGSTSDLERKLLRKAQDELKLSMELVEANFIRNIPEGERIKIQLREINRQIRELKGLKEEAFQEQDRQDQELLKPLKIKVVKFFFKYASDVLPSVDMEILMKATKLTREEIEALKPPK
jgi:hypothetical protein